MKTLEEITYEAGRDALADQESIVSGIRHGTGTLLAAQALVASFLGSAATRSGGFSVWAWLAIGGLVAGLSVAVAVLAPWRMRFAIDARDLYDELYPQVAEGADSETQGWLAAAGFVYQALRVDNAARVRRMTRLSTVLGILVVLQTVLWLAALEVQ